MWSCRTVVPNVSVSLRGLPIAPTARWRRKVTLTSAWSPPNDESRVESRKAAVLPMAGSAHRRFGGDGQSRGRRRFSKVNDSRPIQYVLEDVDGEEDPLGDVRNFLYPEEDDEDERLLSVSHADSVEGVFAALGSDEARWSHRHTSQAVATLFHLRKLCGLPDSHERDCANLRDFAELMDRDGSFSRLVSGLHQHYQELELDKLAYIFMCLRRLSAPFEVSPCDILLRDMQIRLARHFDDMDLTTLTYFIVGLRDRNMQESRTQWTSLTWGLALAPAMPRLAEFIREAETVEDLTKLAICINAASRITSDNLMDSFASKVQERIDAGAYTSQTDSSGNLCPGFERMAATSLCKILSLSLTKKDWHINRGDFTRNLLLELKDRVNLLNPLQTVLAFKVCYRAAQPMSVCYDLLNRLEKMYKENVDESYPNVSKGDILNMLFLGNSQYLQYEDGKNILKGILRSENWPWDFNNVFTIVQRSRTCDDELNELMFSRALELQDEHPTGQSQHFDQYLPVGGEFEHTFGSGQLNTRLAIRYMVHRLRRGQNFFSNRNFEERMLERLNPILLDTPFVRQFSISLAFRLAFGDDLLTEEEMRRFNSMVSVMDSLALHTIVMGAKRRRQGLKKRDENEQLESILDQITVAVVKRLQILLKDTSTQDTASKVILLETLWDLGRVIEDSDLRDASQALFSELCMNNLSAGIVGKLAAKSHERPSRVNLQPEMMDAFIRYLLDNRVHFLSRNFFPILLAAFTTNYDVEGRLGGEGKAFLSTCNSVFLRDFDHIVGFSVIRAGIALGKYRALSRDLATKLFSDDFMKKLDSELENFDEPYVEKLKSVFMELNRVVHLLYPEYEIPWFHESYQPRQHHRRTMSPSQATFREEVYERLSNAVGGYRFVQEDVFSPYLNPIDFEIVVDGQGRFVPALDASGSDRFALMRRSGRGRARRQPGEGQWRHVAVLVATEGETVDNGRRNSGWIELRAEELELQGYEVVKINQKEWNALNMAEAEEKEKFFKHKLKAMMA